MKVARLAVIPTLPMLLALPILACGDGSALPPTPPASTSTAPLAGGETVPSFEERVAQYQWTTIKIAEPITFSQDTNVRQWLLQSGRVSQAPEGPVRLMFTSNVSVLEGVTVTSDVPLFVSTPASLTLGNASAITGPFDLFVQVSKIILPPGTTDTLPPNLGGGIRNRVITGEDGASGTQGQNGECDPFRVAQAGTDGSPGGPGPRGQDAASMSLWVTEITPFPSWRTHVTLGAAGQPGGPGGVGGWGGNGGNGMLCEGFTVWGKQGGRGGAGGRGGDGGNGGNISLYYYSKDKGLLDYVSTSNPGGKPGVGGEAGQGGAGGVPGGAYGAPGAAGATGTWGRNGKVDIIGVANKICCIDPKVLPRSP